MKLNSDLPRRTSLRRCCRGSPGGWFWTSSKWHFNINTEGRFKEKEDNRVLDFDFDLPYRPLPRRCSLGSPGAGVEFLSYETWI